MAIDHHSAMSAEARRIYEEELRETLEQTHMHSLIAIEPVSGEYFLGKTLSEARQAAQAKYPDRMTHIMRVGHKGAVEFGYQQP